MLNSTAKRRVHGGQVRDCCYSSSHQFYADGCKLANDIDVDSSGRKWTHASEPWLCSSQMGTAEIQLFEYGYPPSGCGL